MSSRSKILDAIKKNKPQLSPLPEIPEFDNETVDKVAFLNEVMSIIGGVLEEIKDMDVLPSVVEAAYPNKKIIGSNIENFPLTTLDVNSIEDPHDLQNLDLIVLKGEFVVAENGAVWISEKDLVHRANAYITQHMALVVNREDLVWNMHQAYKRLELDRPGYGVFISGPSKTADIEQSLVIGAHGSRSMTLFLVG
ncbi:MAG: lactate utilization protein B/C [Thalassobius sp.]|nr:lactate utilization protein B/C [Thalassovita sp.]|tara:strand:+ start:731 stop:1315 length:585 start_codon:yes stop_codon:yes gene_type:complete